MESEGKGKYIIELLYDQHAPALLSLCKRYCGKIEDAEDMLHDGFIKIIKNLDKFEERSPGSLQAWMKRIMVNTALNHIRDHSREKNIFNIDPYLENYNIQEPEVEIPFEELAGKIEKDELLEMISSLPPGYRSVFNLYVFESFTHKEIAEALGCSESTSKSQLLKARGLLKKKLQSILDNKLYQNEKKQPSYR